VSILHARPPRAGRAVVSVGVPGRWVAACAAAEAVGMTAAALAARLGTDVAPAAGLALVVAGGLVEGTALGTAQAVLLRRLLPRLRRARYVAATVLVAGLGWAAASAPAVLSSDEGGTTPRLPLVLLGAAGLGLVMGAGLGAVQSWALRGAAPHPWRWTTANVAAWPGAMAVIFVGATTPGEDWRLDAVLGLALVTGALAGALLGVVTGRFLPAVTGRRG
jgi:hypothetical protein